MEPNEGTDPCHDLLLSMRRQMRDANLKLDHLIFRMMDQYDRESYDSYGRHIER